MFISRLNREMFLYYVVSNVEFSSYSSHKFTELKEPWDEEKKKSVKKGLWRWTIFNM